MSKLIKWRVSSNCTLNVFIGYPFNGNARKAIPQTNAIRVEKDFINFLLFG